MEASTHFPREPPIGYKIANALLFHKIKKALGIEKCHVFYNAGAPLNEDIKHFFSGVDIIIRELYASSETGCLGISTYPDIKMKVILKKYKTFDFYMLCFTRYIFSNEKYNAAFGHLLIYSICKAVYKKIG